MSLRVAAVVAPLMEVGAAVVVVQAVLELAPDYL